MYCYYGDPNSTSDGFDQSQYDFHSSKGECTKADENGNKGQLINGVRVLGPKVATVDGEIAAKDITKVVPFALAVQGGLAAHDAYNAYHGCAAEHY